ncbi:hypothetical protein JG688_00012019 [Phytophthora aleatoria]|uniref:Uncharacterized protein n=1 Tax=Phytophthora aleatoria TaxID=2496075 RepID=A0A8J5IRQ2_9STRA|nr:hypothetical protein JG688_00012019 [Phytophthora aleatoria]
MRHIHGIGRTAEINACIQGGLPAHIPSSGVEFPAITATPPEAERNEDRLGTGGFAANCGAHWRGPTPGRGRGRVGVQNTAPNTEQPPPVHVSTGHHQTRPYDPARPPSSLRHCHDDITSRPSPQPAREG